MKKFWKALGLAAIAAAVVPVKVKKDEETGKRTYQSLLGKLDFLHGEEGTAIDVTSEGVLSGIIANAVTKKEGVLFADDEPEAAVVEPIAAVKAEQAEAPAEEISAVAEEAEATAEEAAVEAEATEEDFDPEL